MNGCGFSAWIARKRQQRARRALVLQLAHQTKKAHALRGHEQQFVASRYQWSQKVRAILEGIQPIHPDAHILEVGSGAHGLVFFFGAKHGVGIDPLALEYTTLFPAWQRRAVTVTAFGEALPFRDSSFDVVLSDNVVDHTERPEVIMTEIARVLTPFGLLYFTVYTHHFIYAAASLMHSSWQALGLPYEIRPFAGHTTHFTLKRARRLLKNLPFRILQEKSYIAEAKASARQSQPRHLGDRLKRIFFKNALLEIVAVRQPKSNEALT